MPRLPKLISFILFLFCSTQLSAQPSKIDTAFLESVAGEIGFLENKGQILDQTGKVNNAVKYLLPLRGNMNVQVRANGFSYDTYIIDTNQRESKWSSYGIKDAPTFRFHRVDIQFPGANPNLVLRSLPNQ